jgi:4-amino-4-deoxy-L-arabinose transferase-like glycosyltransferase
MGENWMLEKVRFSPEHLLLAAIGLVALLLRVYGIEFGLPLHYHIDETRVMSRVMKMVTTGDLNPHFFHYPSFIFYFLSVLVAGYYGVHFIPFALGSIIDGRVPSLSAFRLAFEADVTTLYLIGRLSNALFGVLTVLLVYFLVRELFNRRTAFFASIALAVTPLHALESHYIKQEVLMTLFMMLALYIAVRGVGSARKTSSYLVGVTSGIAASVKYNGILALSVAPLLFRKQGRLSISSFFGKGMFLTAAVAVLAFLVFSPYVVLDFSRFSTDFVYEMFHVAEKGHPGFDLNGEGLIYHRVLYQVLAAFPFSLGLPIYIFSLLGIVFGIFSRDRGFLWIVFFVLPYFLATSVMKVVFLRYYMPIIVVLCITAGYALSVLTSRRGFTGRIAYLIACAAIIYTGFFTWSLERDMPRGRSTLDEGLEWIVGNAGVGSKIAYTHFTPPLSEETYDLVHMRPQHFNPEWLEEESPAFILTSRLVTVGFERGGEGVDEGKKFLEDLRANKLGYFLAKASDRDFLNRGFFERLDPTLANTFMPGIEIFAKEEDS